MPGARLSEVARRWQLCPQQIYGWRRAACRDVQAPPAGTTGSVALGFVPIVSDVIPSAPAPRAVSAAPAPVIEIRLAGAVVRVSATDDTARLTAVLRAVRASGSPA